MRPEPSPHIVSPSPTQLVAQMGGHALEWYQDRPADLSEFGIPSDAFVVGCVANDRPRKGLPILLEASKSLPADSNIHFLLVGSGMDKEHIAQLIAASPMAERIHIAGFRKDAPALIAACDVSVLPSIKREGLPKTVIEAMAYTTTPIVSDTGGSAELIEDGVSGLVVEPGKVEPLAEAIQSLWENPERTKKMGEKARERIPKFFSTEKSAKDTLAFFEAMLALRK